MLIDLQIIEQFQSQITSQLLENAALVAIRHQAVPDNAALSIVIADDQQLHQLNHQFRDIDAPTDVLSFPASHVDPENGSPYLGDIIISFLRAESQASADGHSIMEELQLLVVHGILHLLGHDHAAADEKSRMWSAQAEILQQLGISDTLFPT
ncbi:MAG: rRNA maturation RNase YbeY [Anaerolineae bacterium]|nr:rRNA maturation RNase YbeY [Anaerolineae bacterium]